MARALTSGLSIWARLKSTDRRTRAAGRPINLASTTSGTPRNMTSSARAAGANIATVTRTPPGKSLAAPPSLTHAAPPAKTPSTIASAAGKPPSDRPVTKPCALLTLVFQRRSVASSRSSFTPMTHVASPNAIASPAPCAKAKSGGGCRASSAGERPTESRRTKGTNPMKKRSRPKAKNARTAAIARANERSRDGGGAPVKATRGPSVQLPGSQRPPVRPSGDHR